jgi:hypothetical protein
MESGQAAARVAAPALDKDESGLRLSITIDGQGAIALVAVPQKQDGAAAAALVREVLALAGRLWNAPVSEFLKTFGTRLGRPVQAALAEKSGPGWDEKSWAAGLEQSLNSGRPSVYLLVQTLEPGLGQAAAHLCSLNLPVTVLGAELYRSWGIDVVLPRRHALTEAAGVERARAVQRPTPPPKPVAATAAARQPAEVRPRPAAAPVVTQAKPAAQAPAQPVQTTQSFVPPPGFGSLEPAPAKPEAEPPVEAAPKKPEPATHIWSGTQPGVMAGKRPAPKTPPGKPK